MTGRAARGHYFEKAEDLMHLSIVLEPAGHCGHWNGAVGYYS